MADMQRSVTMTERRIDPEDGAACAASVSYEVLGGS